jgi:hypothetical protein
LFDNVDLFVRDIRFLLFILHTQIFVMFILFIHSTLLLCVMFNIFVRRKQSFVHGVQIFVPVMKINYSILKNTFKVLCKYRQVWSYFDDFVIRNIIVQFKFNLDARFNIFIFLILNLHAYR